ncbi:hypothetical protein DITRI_Ditri20bG0044500 [Diplodiscus trichospermus]
MAEAIVSTILKQLNAITSDKASEAWTLVRGVEEDVKRLERNFEALQYEVEDAEEKQYLDKSLKHWLDRFKEVSYDMEDVLDEWKIAIQEMQSADYGDETSTTSILTRMVRLLFVSCFSFVSQVVKRHEIGTRIKYLNEKLDQIVKDKDKFGLIKREMIKQPKPSESTSFVDVSKLYGRLGVKEDIIEKLLFGTSEEEGSCIPTISIVGMGGLGKTALAQLIYNDHRIQAYFDKIIWVSVSDPFDQIQIAKAILEALDPGSTISLQNNIPLQALLSSIRGNIKEKKFFLVLDDVWVDHGQDWEQLRPTFQFHMLGSRILITTRKESVAKHMESSHVFHLDLLSEEICWIILRQKAFSGRKSISCENLEDIGRKIAKKCKGLPLAAKTLGGLLQDKLRREEWQNVLNSEIWKSGFAKEDIFTPLLLSYYDLPSAVKRCFLYCAILPKGDRIDKDKLVQSWMGQGYLNFDDNLGTELEGEDCFKCLASCSFFQDFEKDNKGDIISCKMHDLVHDFVQFLTKDGFITEEKVGNLILDLSSKKARHLRLEFRGRGDTLSINGADKFRSCVAVSDGFNRITNADLQNFLSQSKHLRLLEFQRFEFFDVDVKEFPRYIGKLIHLRYLGFESCNGIKNLIEAVCELHNLQSLNLRLCYQLQKLPVGIGKLINLRYLSTEGCKNLAYYPKGISNLTALLRLDKIRMRADGIDSDEFSIGNLENLDLLTGNLRVELTGNGIDWNEAKRAKLHNKIHLKRMYICIDSPDIKKEEVVQALNPPSNLHVTPFDYNTWTQVQFIPLVQILQMARNGRRRFRLSSGEKKLYTIKEEREYKNAIKEKTRVALSVQKAALQFIDSGVSGNWENDTDREH